MWYPTGIEGCLVILVYVYVVTRMYCWLDLYSTSTLDTLVWFITPFLCVTGIFIAICGITGDDNLCGWSVSESEKDTKKNNT